MSPLSDVGQSSRFRSRQISSGSVICFNVRQSSVTISLHYLTEKVLKENRMAKNKMFFCFFKYLSARQKYRQRQSKRGKQKTRQKEKDKQRRFQKKREKRKKKKDLNRKANIQSWRGWLFSAGCLNQIKKKTWTNPTSIKVVFFFFFFFYPIVPSNHEKVLQKWPFFSCFLRNRHKKKTGEKQLPHVFFMFKKNSFKGFFFLNVNL